MIRLGCAVTRRASVPCGTKILVVLGQRCLSQGPQPTPSPGLGRSAKKLYAKIQQFLGSLKKVAVETWRLLPVRRKLLKSRAELEKIRENNESLIPMVILIAAQFVPVLGNIPVLVALGYPRLLLTASFWSDEQCLEIRAAEFLEKESAREVLLQIIERLKDPRPTQFSVQALVQDLADRGIGLEDVSNSHLAELAKANALYSSPMVYELIRAPLLNTVFATLVRKRLEKRASEISRDDELLRVIAADPEKEGGGLDKLELPVLITACTRRGSSPVLDRDQCLAYLGQWLATPVLTSAANKKHPLLFCHALALPGLFR